MEIKRFHSKDEAAAEAGEYLNKLLTDNLNRPILLMLSGGSSISILDYVGKSALGPNLTISVIDERFTTDTEKNNFAQLQKTDFYETAFEAESSFFGTLPRTEDTMQTLTERWEKNLRAWREENPNGIIMATVGMGADGHTQGIVPYPENPQQFKHMFEGNSWLVAYDAGSKSPYPLRITTTRTFFKLINIGIGFVCGAEKKTALEGLIKKQGQAYQLPALAWHEMENLTVFTDIN